MFFAKNDNLSPKITTSAVSFTHTIGYISACAIILINILGTYFDNWLCIPWEERIYETIVGNVMISFSL